MSHEQKKDVKIDTSISRQVRQDMLFQNTNLLSIVKEFLTLKDLSIVSRVNKTFSLKIFNAEQIFQRIVKGEYLNQAPHSEEVEQFVLKKILSHISGDLSFFVYVFFNNYIVGIQLNLTSRDMIIYVRDIHDETKSENIFTSRDPLSVLSEMRIPIRFSSLLLKESKIAFASGQYIRLAIFDDKEISEIIFCMLFYFEDVLQIKDSVSSWLDNTRRFTSRQFWKALDRGNLYNVSGIEEDYWCHIQNALSQHKHLTEDELTAYFKIHFNGAISKQATAYELNKALSEGKIIVQDGRYSLNGTFPN